MRADGFGELVVALLALGGGQVAWGVGDDLHGDMTGVHIGDALGAELKKPVIEPWGAFQALIAESGMGIGDAGEEVLFKGDYWPGHFWFSIW